MGDIKNPETFPFILLGNKCDRETERKVTRDKAETWCQENGGYAYFETSAKDGVAVDDAFEKITTLASEQIKEEPIYISAPKIDLTQQNRHANTQQNCSC